MCAGAAASPPLSAGGTWPRNKGGGREGFPSALGVFSVSFSLFFPPLRGGGKGRGRASPGRASCPAAAPAGRWWGREGRFRPCPPGGSPHGAPRAARVAPSPGCHPPAGQDSLVELAVRQESGSAPLGVLASGLQGLVVSARPTSALCGCRRAAVIPVSISASVLRQVWRCGNRPATRKRS